MPRSFGRLTALNASRAKQRGLYADGGGLYLRVGKTGNKSWVFRFMLKGKAREMGLGAFRALSLADARLKASTCRKMLAENVDPIEARNTSNSQQALAAAQRMPFQQCAEAYIAAHVTSWRNNKHKVQWFSTLKTYVYPVLGDVPVQQVDVGLVMKVLEPIWLTKTETASRIRSRIENVLDWATARKYRQGDNPARWRGHLENLLARPTRIAKVKHHPALPYSLVGDFMADLQVMAGIASLALQFTILTAVRTSETLGASWDEIDLNKRVWTIPAARIKAGREHRIPLSDPALAILRDIAQKTGGMKGYVFPSRHGKAMSNMALLAVLKRMRRTDITAHGFRSSFRDWVAEQTNFPREVAEAALAHVVRDKVEAAYQRGDLFDKRRQLMDAWAVHCTGASIQVGGDNVFKLRVA